MEKVKKYKEIIRQYFEEKVDTEIYGKPEVKPTLIVDEKKQSYVLFWIGWSKHKYNHGLMYHVQIIGDKVWIHEDRTDKPIAEKLYKRGIPRKDIVLGFLAPYEREMSDYAVA